MGRTIFPRTVAVRDKISELEVCQACMFYEEYARTVRLALDRYVPKDRVYKCSKHLGTVFVLRMA